jgi:4-carboxymuconolactone decarboxylase
MSDKMADRQKGEERIRRLFGEAYYQRNKAVPAGTGRAEFRELGYELTFGRLYDRPGLDDRTRLLCTIAALTVLKLDKQLAVYIGAARNTGISQQEIKEIIMLMSIYGGFPAALNSMGIADDSFANEVAADKAASN